MYSGFGFRFWFVALLAFCFAACQYPYYTPQARQARKENKARKKQERKTKKDELVLAPDTAVLQPSVDTLLLPAPDTLPKVGKTDKFKPGNTPGDTSITPLDSSALVIAPPATDSTNLALSDSLGAETPDTTITPWREIAFSQDSLYYPVQYNALDSMIYDVEEKKVYLYGGAEVYYEQYSLKAGFIVFDFNTNVATAEGFPDSTGQLQGRPLFNDGGQEFEARKIQYNFKTKKGKVYDAATTQGDGFFLAAETKFIAKDAPGSTNPYNDVVYSHNGIYTTCNHYEPHFGIRISKAKVVPGKLLVAGPAYLEIMGTPTPFALPFAFFPLKLPNQRKSGLILNTDLEFSPALGPGIKGVGYYWSIGEFFDLALTGDVYTRGSFRLRASSRYNRRYKVSGSVDLGYSRLRIDEKGNPNYSLRQDFNFRWTHQQDPKAHPTQTFQASVNIGTSTFFQNTTNDAAAVLQNNFQSSISYLKRFAGTPVSLSISFAHSQNTQTRAMSLTLPRFDIRVNRVTPFARKKRVGAERWYERIGLSYTFAAQNTLNTIDSVFFNSIRYGNFQQDVLEKMEYSVRHTPTLDFSFKLFKHINVQPSVNYSETWFFYRNEKVFDPTLSIRYDTIYENDTTIKEIKADTTFGQVVDLPRSETYGFYPVRDMSAGVNLNTQFFAIGSFRGKKMPAGESHKLRLTVRPNIGFQWRPDYSRPFWGYYDSVQTDVRYPLDLQGYRRFPTVPSAGKSALLNYSLTMTLDGKFWKRPSANLADSIVDANASSNTEGSDKSANAPGSNYKKTILLNNLTFNGNYNIIADSLHWSPLNIRANTRLFRLFDVTFFATLDPYAADPRNNNRIQRFQWKETGELMRMTSMGFNVSTGFSMQDLRNIFTSKKQQQAARDAGKTETKPPFELFQNFRIAYNLTLSRRFINGVDSTVVGANELSLSGTINLSKGWNIIIGRVGYDFRGKRITYPDFTFARDLHCWQMGVSWQPERRTWSFFLRVRPGSLGFINVPVRKNFYDPF